MNRYTAEQKEFLFRFIPGHSSADVAVEFNRRFPKKITAKTVQSFKKNHGIRAGTRPGNPKGYSIIYPAGFKEFLREHNAGKTLAEITVLLNRHFSTEFSQKQIKYLRRNMRLNSGLDGRFTHGHIPHNQGRKGFCPAGCDKGWFKKGEMPTNHLPVGAEIETKDGYLKIKVGEPKSWKFKHRLVWEELHGPIPAGHVITFKDGDTHNCAAENLMCITREVNRELNRRHLRSSNPEITQAGASLANLMIRIHSLETKGGM